MGRFRCKSLGGGGVSLTLTVALAAFSLILFAPHAAVGGTVSQLLDIDGNDDGLGGVVGLSDPQLEGHSIVVGTMESTTQGVAWEAWAAHLDEDGGVVWEATYPLGTSSKFYNVIESEDDDEAIAIGFAARGGDAEFYVVRFEVADGDIVWQITYEGDDHDVGRDLALLENVPVLGDMLMLVGWTDSFDATPVDNVDFWILVVDPSDGSIFEIEIRPGVWKELQVKIGGPDGQPGEDEDKAYAVVADPTNTEFVIVGCTESWGSGDQDVWVLRTSNLLEAPVFQTTYGGGRRECAYGATLSGTSDVVIVGEENSSDAEGNVNIWMLQIDDAGDINWQQSYTSAADNVDEVGTAVTELDDGRLLVAGWGDPDTATLADRDSRDFLLFNVDPDDGTLDGGGWAKFYDCYPSTMYHDQAWGVAQASDDDLLMVGESIDNVPPVVTDWDAWFLKLNEDGDVLDSGSVDGVCRFDDPLISPEVTTEDYTDSTAMLKFTEIDPEVHNESPVDTDLTPDVRCPQP